MSNTILTISEITNEALMILENEMKVAGEFSRQYDESFGRDGRKIGDTLDLRLPARFVGGEGQNLTIENFEERSVPLVLEKQFHIGLQFSSKEMTLDIDTFGQRVLQPQVSQLANNVNNYCAGVYADVHNFVGVPGTTPNALLTYLQAGQKLDEEAAPRDGMRTMIINPAAEVSIVDSLKGLTEASRELARQYRTGHITTAAGFNWLMDQNIKTHTVGPLGGTPLTNGANQTGSSIITDGWTAAVGKRLNEGDVITFASVNAVNPQSRESTGSLRNFVVTEDVYSDVSGNATIPIYPALTPSGQWQTVDAAVGDGAAVLTFGHASSYAGVQTPANLAMHREFAALGVADLMLPEGTDKAYRASDNALGISFRFISDYEIRGDQTVHRCDVLVGRVAKRPQLATRVQA